MNNPLRDDIMAHFCQLSYFSDYKYRKRDRSLTKQMPEGVFRIEFQMWQSWDREADDYACEVIPLCSVNFDILRKWFEKYSFKPLSVQKDISPFLFGGSDYGLQDSFLFLYDGSNFNRMISTMQKDVILLSNNILEDYGSLEKVYNKIIEPLLDGGGEWPNGAGGVEWVFEYLKLCSIIRPERYGELKGKVTMIIESMCNRKYPNINMLEYQDKLDIIFADIEQFLH